MGLGGLSSRAKGHSSRRKNPSTPLSNPDPFPRRGQDTRESRGFSPIWSRGLPQTLNPSHSLSCGPTVCLRAEGQVLLPVCIHSPGGSPPTPQTSRGLPYPQRALVSRPQLQALYRAQGPGCAATSPLSSRGARDPQPGGGSVCTWAGPHPSAAPPAPAVWPHAGSSPQSRGRSGRG